MSRVVQKIDEVATAPTSGGSEDSPYDSEVYVLADDSAKLPTRWIAPECLFLEKKRFSEKSDVWAFAITVIETYSVGEQPYSKLRMKNGRKWNNGAVCHEVSVSALLHIARILGAQTYIRPPLSPLYYFDAGGGRVQAPPA